MKCKPEDSELCVSVRAGSVAGVWVGACISLFSLPMWQTWLMKTAPACWCVSLKPPVGKPPRFHLGLFFRLFFSHPRSLQTPHWHGKDRAVLLTLEMPSASARGMDHRTPAAERTAGNSGNSGPASFSALPTPSECFCAYRLPCCIFLAGPGSTHLDNWATSKGKL